MTRADSADPAVSTSNVLAIIKDIIDAILCEGDIAVQKHSERFDRWLPVSFELSQADIDKVIAAVLE